MKLRASWYGPPPNVGDFLMSGKRPRGAYRILAINARSGSGVSLDLHGEPTQKLELECERVALSDVPKDATIYNWTWSVRTRKPVVWK